MDEAARCDRLLLIREGRLIADDTPDAVRAATGTDDLEEAFLRLIRADEASPTARRSGVVMNPRILAAHHRPHPAPAAPRPAHRRAAGGGADRCC